MAYRITAIWFLSILSIFSLNVGHAQKTVGLIDYQPGEVTKGYNLIFPHNQPNVYLLDNCGQVVHRWEDEDDYRPGNSVYLLENGNLVKCKRHVSGVVDPIWAGGGGAVVEILDWDNNLLWSFEQNDSLRRLHHDVEVLPNGNIIMISWEKKTFEEAIQAGRDTALMTHDELWPDYLLEVDPNTDSIVWEWHVWDHLIQDHDPTKDNFGVIRDHPELVNVNFVMGEGVPDWMHSNYVDYNPELDQIMFSVNFFSEVWIIDHSTSTEEAAGHSGGRSGRGGDLLYRWGNPMAYDRGNELDQRLFSQHDTRWLDDFVDQSHPDFGKILLFNNRFHPDYSAAHVIRPAFDTANWEYPRELSNRWGPNTYDRTILHPDTFPLHSTGLSSVQALPDQHWLLFSGRFGNAFELNEF
ncbi:MAG: aryl-sulfate sulfotransferase, partial [Saprospiraceae bacterium]|nr:aryl-sulfate sulfotransferase [Saprospiraceae bacterium]